MRASTVISPDSSHEDFVRSLFAGVTSGYDTHRPVLGEAVLRTSGPILELGTGHGSTPSLHQLSEARQRRVFSFDHDREWIAEFAALKSEDHFLAWLKSWDDCPIESGIWGVAFVDHAPAERRVVELRRLAFRAQVIVVHDTEDPEYGYETLFGAFAYRRDDRTYKQWTTLLSNYVDVSDWSIQHDRR